MSEQKAPKQQKQKAAKKHYTSKGQRRSSMSTAGHSDLFITSNRHTTVGWSAKDREAHEKRIRSGYKAPVGDPLGD